MDPSLYTKQHFRNLTFSRFAFLMLIDLQFLSFLRNIIAKTLTYPRLPTLLITLLPINIAIQIAMLVNILRPIPINYYHNTIVSITIISDRLHSI
jgi:hypothetical protein